MSIREQKRKERNIMVANMTITKATTFGGAFLVLVGLLGFIAPGFMGMHLSPPTTSCFYCPAAWRSISA
jgi:hypothetical protein